LQVFFLIVIKNKPYCFKLNDKFSEIQYDEFKKNILL